LPSWLFTVPKGDVPCGPFFFFTFPTFYIVSQSGKIATQSFQKPSAAVIFDSLINDKLQGFSFLPGQFPEHLPGKFTDSDRCGWHISCPLGNVFISQYNIVYIFATFS